MTTNKKEPIKGKAQQSDWAALVASVNGFIHFRDRFFNEATSEYIPAAQEDLERNLEICDLIKSRQANSRTAMRAIKERLKHRNPNVQLLALALTDACIKNTSHYFLREVCSREFVDVLVELCKDGGGSEPVVCRKAQEFLQMWALLLGNQQDSLQYMQEAYEQARREGVNFPPPPRILPTAKAIVVTTEAPPEWTDSASCVRCNVAFGVLLRKHHCRQCGKTFCQDCSGKTIALPEFGLYDEVRVCESCFAKKFSQRTSREYSIRESQQNNPSVIPFTSHQLDKKNNNRSHNDDDDGDDDDELNRAIKLSLEESHPGGGPLYNNNGALPKVPVLSPSNPITLDNLSLSPGGYDEEAALAAAIAASLQEKVQQQTPTINTNSNTNPITTTPSQSAFNPSGSTLSKPTTVRGGEDDFFMLISPIERENIQLFSQLVERMNSQDEALGEPQFLQLAQSMIALRDRLQKSLSTFESPPMDIPRLIVILEGALLQYEQLTMGGGIISRHKIDDYSACESSLEYIPDISNVPTRPRSQTGSITFVDAQTHQHRLPPPPSAEVAPVLRPIPLRAPVPPEPTLLIPLDEPEGQNNTESLREDPLAGLLDDDVPLIQL